MLFRTVCPVFSLLVVTVVGCVAIETGIVQSEPRFEGGYLCTQYLTFSCTTTGLGDTEIKFENISDTVFRFRHNRFPEGTPNQDDNASALDGELLAGNTTKMNCTDSRSNTTTVCYTVMLVARITNRTICQPFTCSTIYSNGTDNVTVLFGRAFISRTPPPRPHISVGRLSMGSVTIAWESGTIECPDIMYMVTTFNCGSCSSVIKTTISSITCENLVADQECNVSVQSVLECGAFSDPATLTVHVPATSVISNIARDAGIGVTMAVVVLIILLIVVILVIYNCVKRRSTKISFRKLDCEQEQLVWEISGQQESDTTSCHTVEMSGLNQFEDHSSSTLTDKQPGIQPSLKLNTGPLRSAHDEHTGCLKASQKHGTSERSDYLTTDDIREVQNKTWKARCEWKEIGTQLGLQADDLEVIERNNNNKQNECFREMLLKWLRQGTATWEALISALKDECVGRVDVANLITSSLSPNDVNDDEPVHLANVADQEIKAFTCPLCGICSIEQYLNRECPKANSTSDSVFPYLDTSSLSDNERMTLFGKLHGETKKIIKSFGDLVFQLRKSLVEESVNPRDIATYIHTISRSSLQSLEAKEITSFNDIIDHLLQNNYMSFFNYFIIEYIISIYEIQETRTKLEDYKEKFKTFCQRSVFEVPQNVFGIVPNGGKKVAFKVTSEMVNFTSTSEPDDDSSPKFPSVKKSSETLKLSLIDTLDIQEKVTKALGLQTGELVFLSASKGCITLTFSAPKTVVQKELADIDTLSANSHLKSLEASGIHIMCGPPGKPFATNLTPKSVSLQWTRPEYQGFHPVQCYLVHYQSLNNGLDKWRMVQSVSLTLTIERLSQKDSPYIFKVQATSSIGVGVQSEISDPIHLMPPPSTEESDDILREFPSKPGKPRVVNINRDSVQLEWTRPEKGSDIVTSYSVLYRCTEDPPSHWMEIIAESSAESILVSHLSQNTTYFFKVQPECGGVYGHESETSDPVMTTNHLLNKLSSLNDQFLVLKKKLLAELKSSKDVTVYMLLKSLIILPSELQIGYQEYTEENFSDIEQSEAVRQLYLRINLDISFFDYGMLNHLIKTFGSDRLKREMSNYVKEMQLFFYETSVKELMDEWLNHEDLPCNLLLMIDRNPHTYSLWELFDLRKKICIKAQMSEIVFTFAGSKVNANSFIMMLTVPSMLVSKIAETLNQIEDGFYECEGITSALLNHQQLLSVTKRKRKPEGSTSLLYKVEGVMKEVIKWNEDTLTVRQIEDNLMFLLRVRRDIIDKTLSLDFWNDTYLSHSSVQNFLESVMNAMQHEEHLYIKLLVQHLFEQKGLSANRLLTDQNVANIKLLSKWLYGSDEMTTITSMQKECDNFENFDKFLNKIIEDCASIMSMDQPSLRASQELDNASCVSTAINNLRSHYRNTYDDILITILVYPFQKISDDGVITLQPITLDDLKVMLHLLSSLRKDSAILEKPQQLQAFLFYSTIDSSVCQASDSEDKQLLQRIKQMMIELDNPPLEAQLIEAVNNYLSGSSKLEFMQVLQSLMSCKKNQALDPDKITDSDDLLKKVLQTTPYEFGRLVDPFNQFGNNPDAYTLFENLGLTKHYPGKLGLQDALCIRQETLELSLNRHHLKELKQIPNLIMHKIMSYDSQCMAHNMPQNDDDSFSYIFDNLDSSDNDNESDFRSDNIHPVDSLLALILCSDDFLRQDLYSRLAKCQLAVPFLIPDPFTKELILPLWAMQAITKDWKSPQASTNLHPIISYKMPIVSFIRFGKTYRGVSKSKLLNEVISDLHYDHFFDCDCPGGHIKPLLREGLVDMCWYLPGGTTINDTYPHPITFLNLHGDARYYAEQVKCLSQISSMCFVLLSDSEIDIHIVDKLNLKQFSLSPGGIIVLKDIKEKLPRTLQTEIPRIRIINLTTVTNTAHKIKVAIQSVVREKMPDFNSIEVCANSIITEYKLSADVTRDEYKHGSSLANEIIRLVTDSYDKDQDIKDAVLPLQGESLWKAWAKINKECYRQLCRSNRTVCNYTETLGYEKKRVRMKQLKLGKALTPVMDLFMVSLLKLGGSSNRIARNYFLQCLKQQLEAFSREKISGLEHRYQTSRITLVHAMTPKAKMDARQEMESIHKQLLHASFGLEHLLREVGQVYEAALQSSEYGEELSCLPKAVAELLVEGYPVELMDGDAAHVPVQWVSAVIKEVTEMLYDPKVCVLSVIGLQGTGKSTMLNASFGLQFSVSAGRCTRGAFMQLIPFDEDLHRQTKCSYMLVVDTEGLRAPELDSMQSLKHDNELATFVIGLADVTLINIYGEVPGDMDDILQTSIHAFLRMSEVRYHPSCQFIYQNASATIRHSEIGRFKLTDRLNKLTIDAAREENCEGLYETFNDIIKFDDQTDVHYFPALWKGDPPMAPVSEGYSRAAQMLKSHLIELLLERSNKDYCNSSIFNGTMGNLHLSSFEIKTRDLWTALLTENFIFSFNNTLEVTAYYSLETQYSAWNWTLKEKTLKWEQDAENEIYTTDPQDIAAIVGKKLKELYTFVSGEYEILKGKMDTFFKTSILVQRKSKFERKMKNLSEELIDHGVKHCRKIGNFIQANTALKEERNTYATIITGKVKQMIVSLKVEQQELNENIERGVLDIKQSGKILKLDLFPHDKLLRYKGQGIITENQVDQINEYIRKCGGELNEEHLQKLLISELLSAAQMKQILKQGRLSEEQLKVEFNGQWIELVDTIIAIPFVPVHIETVVEEIICKFTEGFAGQLIWKLQDASLSLEVVGEKHYEKNTSSWIAEFARNVHSKFVLSTDSYQADALAQRITNCVLDEAKKYVDQTDLRLEAQRITDCVLDEAKKYVDETCKRDTDFNEVFIHQLLHLLDTRITKEAANAAKHFTFLPEYRLDVYLKACGYAIKEFKKMADSFRERRDPLVYLERHIKGPQFTRFKNQHYQYKAEEAIANNICAQLEEPIQTQVRNHIGRNMVGWMKQTEIHFNSKIALKGRILTDLYEMDNFEKYMMHLTDIKQSFEYWIKYYTEEFCDKKVQGESTRLQIATREEVTRLIAVVELKAREINETNIKKWLATFCEDRNIRRVLGVKLQVDDLLIDQEHIEELNLENFKTQIICSLQHSKKKLYSLIDGIKCENEMTKWKDKPLDLFKDLIGCTEQCPFCGEQCDSLDPEHDITTHKHRTSVHHSTCLVGWRETETQILAIDFCPALVTSYSTFKSIATNFEWHPYREYQKIHPSWSIEPDLTSASSLYWMSFLSRYNNAIANKFHAKPASVPPQWSEIKDEEVKESLKTQHYL